MLNFLTKSNVLSFILHNFCRILQNKLRTYFAPESRYAYLSRYAFLAKKN